jgi:hypothetical protein
MQSIINSKLNKAIEALQELIDSQKHKKECPRNDCKPVAFSKGVKIPAGKYEIGKHRRKL